MIHAIKIIQDNILYYIKERESILDRLDLCEGDKICIEIQLALKYIDERILSLNKGLIVLNKYNNKKRKKRRAKLNKDDIKNIREDKKTMTLNQLKNKYNVSLSTIKRVVLKNGAYKI